jgi:hypothetical protein
MKSTLRLPSINPGFAFGVSGSTELAEVSVERSGLTLHFDRLSVLSLSKEAELSAAEWVKYFYSPR